MDNLWHNALGTIARRLPYNSSNHSGLPEQLSITLGLEEMAFHTRSNSFTLRPHPDRSRS
ncbi:unnamed protein product [Prunus brigantina]